MRSEQECLQAILEDRAIWQPQSVPQWQALFCQADELFYGGQAGGGKSDLLLGLAITAHKKSIIFRRELTQLSGSAGLIERSRDILGQTARYNGIEHTWRDIPGGRSLDFGACQYERDKRKYQGRPHDLKAFDEITEFNQSQYEFLIGWTRTTEEGQRCRVVATGNPPSHADGQWVIERWGPWLDESHPNPAKPGELRWFAVVDGDSTEVDGPEPFEHNGETIRPKSRTFIPARLADNPYLSDTDYEKTIQGLPEPLRTQLLYGDFSIGVEDDPWQVIPTEWVRAAQARWLEMEQPDTPLTAVGLDVARGGRDKTVFSKRYDNWFAPLESHPGSATPDGPTVEALLVLSLDGERDALINVDVIGVGSSVYDSLANHEIEGENGKIEYLDVIGVDFGAGTNARDRSGMLRMRNVRAEAYWGFREALDPKKGDDLALPPDKEILPDLVAPKWSKSASGVLIESKEEIKKRLGRSPDHGDALVLAYYGARGSWMTLLS
jgi:hypothetical protein